jgi:hypothetical protein
VTQTVPLAPYISKFIVEKILSKTRNLRKTAANYILDNNVDILVDIMDVPLLNLETDRG